MRDSIAEIEGYELWSPDAVANYFEKKGLGDYREVLIHHKIVSLKVHLLFGLSWDGLIRHGAARHEYRCVS